MNPQTLREAKGLFNLVKRGVRNIERAEIVICPPFLYLLNLSRFKRENLNLKSDNLDLKLGAQNIFWEKKGAYTGEISPLMLKDAGCKYVIVGHSERRKYFGETDEIINKKLKAVFEAGLIPILCIGETEEQKNKGETRNVLKKQIKTALKRVSSYKLQVSGFCIAYEPIWAIGSGNSCEPKEAQKIRILIEKIISKIYSPKIAGRIRLLYGGSVNSKNAKSYIKEAGLDGLLVGGASLEPKEFIKVVKNIGT